MHFIKTNLHETYWVPIHLARQTPSWNSLVVHGVLVLLLFLFSATPTQDEVFRETTWETLMRGPSLPATSQVTLWAPGTLCPGPALPAPTRRLPLQRASRKVRVGEGGAAQPSCPVGLGASVLDAIRAPSL